MNEQCYLTSKYLFSGELLEQYISSTPCENIRKMEQSYTDIHLYGKGSSQQLVPSVPPTSQLGCQEITKLVSPSHNFPKENSRGKTSKRLSKKCRSELRRHIASNLKRGLYNLKPLLHRRCKFCRHFLPMNIRQHEMMCQNVWKFFEFGCPCGYLSSSFRSIGNHSRSCHVGQYIKNIGITGWFPYVSTEWKNYLSHMLAPADYPDYDCTPIGK
ncbi:uncharacterized protein LOC123037588 isoform X2 [Drosophila rhopaloa]|uniref:C2H2-type domain-containing protein n=1 Tax=Drosophila rhopaloa TaxID=1041015 RepID=A0ABM5J8E9_DRORH|nr:uncharacterized protein LOC123037588 isoform X2 [Drosophila rhopaloa]